MSLEGRIRNGLTCFCAGDALGVPWVGRPPGEIEREELDELPPRADRLYGATSEPPAELLRLGAALVDRDAEARPGMAAAAVAFGWAERDPENRRALCGDDAAACAVAAMT